MGAVSGYGDMDGNSEVPLTLTTCDDLRGRGWLSAAGRATSTLLKKIRICVQNQESHLLQASETPNTLSKPTKASVHLDSMSTYTSHSWSAIEPRNFWSPQESDLRVCALCIKAPSAMRDSRLGNAVPSSPGTRG